MPLNDWMQAKRLTALARQAWGIAQKNQMGVATGAIAGASFGVVTSNEGRGPIANSLFWGAIGVGAGVTAHKLIPEFSQAWQRTKGMYNILEKAPRNFTNPLGTKEAIRWGQKAAEAGETNPGIRAIAGALSGPLETPDEYLTRPKPRSLEQVVSSTQKRIAFYTQKSLKQPIAALDPASQVPAWLGTALEMSLDAAESGDVKMAGRFAKVGGEAGAKTFTERAKSWTWEKVQGLFAKGGLSEIGLAEEGRINFLETLSQKVKSFYEANVGFGIMPEDLGIAKDIANIGAEEYVGAKQLQSILKDMGHKDLEEIVAKIVKTRNSDIVIEGIISPWINKKAISGIRVFAGSKGKASKTPLFTMDVAQASGYVERGASRAGAYVPRQIVDIDTIKDLMGGIDPNQIKMSTLSPAAFVLKQFEKYYQSGEAQEETWRAFAKQVNQSAQIYETGAYRADRSSLIGRPLNRTIRQAQAQVILPGDEAADLARIMGLGTGPESIIDLETGHMRGSQLSDFMKEQGYYQMGSETAGRKMVFERASEILSMDIGYAENPLSKSSAFIRDLGKPYSAIATTEEAAGVMKPFFLSSKMQKALEAGEAPTAYYQQVHGLFETEQQFITDLIFSKNRKEVQGIFKAAGIAKDQWGRLRSNLNVIARVNEGIVATAVPTGVTMTSSRSVEVSALGKWAEGKTLKELQDEISAGKVMLKRHQWVGYDLSTGKPVGHTFSGRERGSAVVKKLKQVRNKQGQMSWVVDLEEHLPARRTKVGTLAYKGFTEPVKGTGEDIVQLINYLRTSGKHASLYNEAIVPLMSGSVDGAVNTFALFESVRKYQNRTQILANNLLGKYMPKMTAEGRTEITKILQQGGINIQETGGRFTGVYESVIGGKLPGGVAYTKQQEQFAKVQQALQQAYEKIYLNTEKVFGKNIFAGQLSKGSEIMRERFADAGARWTAIQAHEMITGMVTPAVMWDALILNVPGRASISMHEIAILKAHGMKRTARELASRIKRTGDQGITAKFYEGMAKASELRDPGMKFTDEILESIGAMKYDLDTVSEISGINIGASFSPSPKSASWRKASKFKDNFVIDLTTASSTMKDAANRVKEALGTTRIFVPGGMSDIWQSEYTLPTGEVINSTKIRASLERLVSHVTKFYESSGDPHISGQHLLAAQKAHSRYMNALTDLMKIPFTGRGGGAIDRGPWAAGRLVYRNYRRQFAKALGSEEAAANVVGVTKKAWQQLQKKGGKIVKIGGQNFMVGIEKRPPITAADPILIALDDKLKEGIAMDDMQRFIRGADFDGDTLTVHAITTGNKDKGAIGELLKAMIDRNSRFNQNYREMRRIADIYGGFGEDLTRRARATSKGIFRRNILEVFEKRMSKFQLLHKQPVTERMAKSWTEFIGMYSNLSKTLQAMTIQHGMSNTEKYHRMMTTNMLQQLSIDFGRKAGSIDMSDPSRLAMDMYTAWQKASSGAVEEGNRMMAAVFKELDFFKTYASEMRQTRKAYLTIGDVASANAVKTDLRVLHRLTTNWFSTVNAEGNLVDLNPKEMAKRAYFIDALAKRGLRAQDYEEQLTEFARTNQILAMGGAEGLGEYPGIRRGSTMAGKIISKSNLYTKQMAKGTKHILADIWKSFRGSNEAKAGATIVGGALAAAGIIGAFSAPTTLSVPDGPSPDGSESGRAFMRAPDRALVGMTGEAPLPGGRGGTAASSYGPEYVPRATGGGNFSKDRRFYYDQTNRTPKVVSYSEDTPENQRATAAYYGTSMGVRGAHVNITTSNNARRISRHEMKYKLQDEMR